MTLQRLEIMQRAWKKCPPPSMSLNYLKTLLKAFMGVRDEVELPAPKNASLPEFANLPDFEE